MVNQKVYKDRATVIGNILPDDRNGSSDESLNSTLVFIDEAFLSKLSRYFGNEKYIKFDRLKFAELISKNERGFLSKVFLYTAPPFQPTNPTKEQILKKEGYDKFIKRLKEGGIVIREGRCQRLKIGGNYIYNQKAVDILLSTDMVTAPVNYPKTKQIILVSNDSDFVPAIEFLNERKIKTILYVYYERKRSSPFSTSNELIKSVYKYKLLKKEDFEKCKIIKKLK